MLRTRDDEVLLMQHPADTTIAEMREWHEAEFRASESAWQDLLSRSSADPLFMSWNWQWSWWRHHASILGARLRLLAAYSAAGKLVGIAPLYVHRSVHRGPIAAMRLETIGSTWRSESGAYSEYLDFVVDGDYEDSFNAAVASALNADREWSDLIIANTKRDSVAARLVHEFFDEACYVRSVDPLSAQLTRLPQSFGDYLKDLKPGVRRKLWNQRKRLSNPTFELATGNRVEELFDQLNQFHQERWGNRLFVGITRAFHLDFVGRCAKRGALRMSALKADGRPLSVMYNVVIDGTEYNIQSGFEANAGAGLSPGYIHFGFCLENACRDGVRNFDFLAGQGRSRNYKQDFVTEETALITFQCIRNRPLAWLYREYDRHRKRKMLSGAFVPPAFLDPGDLHSVASSGFQVF